MGVLQTQFEKRYTTWTQLIKPMIEGGLLAQGFSAAAEAIVDTLSNGNKILICGNGGSACEAQHFAGELVGRFSKERRGLPAIALNSDGGVLTCIGNDYAYNRVFARQIEALASDGDLLIALSTSGNSGNIAEALKQAASMKIDSIALLGKGGGVCKDLAFIPIVVDDDRTDIIQEIHLFLIHCFCHAVDAEFAKDNGSS